MGPIWATHLGQKMSQKSRATVPLKIQTRLYMIDTFKQNWSEDETNHNVAYNRNEFEFGSLLKWSMHATKLQCFSCFAKVCKALPTSFVPILIASFACMYTDLLNNCHGKVQNVR